MIPPALALGLADWLIQSGKGKLQSSKFSVAAGATHTLATATDLAPVGNDTGVVPVHVHVSGVATAGASTYALYLPRGGTLSGYLDNGELILPDVLNAGAIGGNVVSGEASATVYVTLQWLSVPEDVVQDILTTLNTEAPHNPFGIVRGNRF